MGDINFMGRYQSKEDVKGVTNYRIININTNGAKRLRGRGAWL